MNRLIIIGNGFDLAHGMKTGYEHFVLDYFKSVALKACTPLLEFKDEFLDCFVHFGFDENRIEELFSKINSLPELLHNSNINITRTGNGWDKSPAFNEESISFRVKNQFFDGLMNDSNWTDIESYYFTQLLYAFDRNNKNAHVSTNKSFEILREKVFRYLNDQNKNSKNLKNQKFSTFIDTLLSDFSSDSDVAILVNFNYTDVLSNYTGYKDQMQHSVLNIHGKLENEDSLIFGYGDDSHKRYTELEDSNNNELLIHIKSHSYNSDSTYSRLIEFLEMANYEVYIVGHSLGVSDRVLLETIFEHKNCYKIRLYHRGIQSHFKKRIALSRHFKDKKALRTKIEFYSPEFFFE